MLKGDRVTYRDRGSTTISGVDDDDDGRQNEIATFSTDKGILAVELIMKIKGRHEKGESACVDVTSKHEEAASLHNG
jgi:hypothetical protein